MKAYKIAAVFLILLICSCATLPSGDTKQPAENTITESPTAAIQWNSTTKTSTTFPTHSVTASPTRIVEEVGYFQTPTRKEWKTPTTTPYGYQTLTPTPYPTFHIEDVVTATPAQSARCPSEDVNQELNPDLFDENNYFTQRNTLDKVLSLGASFEQIRQLYEDAAFSEFVKLEDLTRDGVDELLFTDENGLLIVKCAEGKYETILSDSRGYNFNTRVFAIEDMNLNGVPDLAILFTLSWTDDPVIDIYEWNGKEMEKVLEMDEEFGQFPNSHLLRALHFNRNFFGLENAPVMMAGAKYNFIDLDQNGTTELVLEDDGPNNPMHYYDGAPWRNVKGYFEWNGEKYLYTQVTFDPPEFRFQAVQDADRFYLFRQYDQALEMYERVISDKSLDYWTMDWKNYFSDKAVAKINGEAPPEKPAEDPNEYEIFSAYAQFRIMLIQMMKSDPQAERMYNQLREGHPQENAGYPFAELARIYREEFTKSADYVAACQPVIEFAHEMPMELAVLGDYYHGDQSHEYRAEDLCPMDETDVLILSGEGE